MSEQKLTRESNQKAWDYAIGMSKVDGGEPSQFMLDLIEQEKRGEIINEDIREKLKEHYTGIAKNEV